MYCQAYIFQTGMLLTMNPISIDTALKPAKIHFQNGLSVYRSVLILLFSNGTTASACKVIDTRLF